MTIKHIRLYVLSSGLLFGLFVSKHAMAEMCKWVDKLGIIHIQECPLENSKDPGKTNRRGERRLAPATRSRPAANSDDDREKTSEVKIDPKVDLYVTSWCPYSREAQAYFKTKGVPFTVFDVEKDPAARRRQKELNPTGTVPTVVINGNVFRGYNPEKFDKILSE